MWDDVEESLIFVRMIKKIKNLIPILLLGVQCLLSSFEVVVNGVDYYGGFKWLWPIGLACIVISADIILFFKKREWFRYAVIITILFGFLGIIRYTVAKNFVTMNSSIELEPISLTMCFIYLLINWKRLFPETTNLPTQPVKTQENVEEYKDRYTNRSSDNLRSILQDSRYRTEAKIAAQEVLKEREEMI